MAPTPERRAAIRSARLHDAPAIARVHVDSWRSTYRGIVPDSVLDSLNYDEREQMWRRAITDSLSQQFVYVAESMRGEIVGFVAGGPERTGDYPDHTGEIYAIYLHESAQGRGLGRGLMETGIRALLDQGHRSMLIWALTENPFCGFYRRLGGERIATQKVTMGRKTLEETAFGWKDIERLLVEEDRVDRGQ
jgi:ribosomal protein S18 acetylase RimI-like enzyme